MEPCDGLEDAQEGLRGTIEKLKPVRKYSES